MQWIIERVIPFWVIFLISKQNGKLGTLAIVEGPELQEVFFSENMAIPCSEPRGKSAGLQVSHLGHWRLVLSHSLHWPYIRRILGKMAWQRRTPYTKSNDFSSFPVTHMEGGKKWILTVVLWHLHMCYFMCMRVQTDKHMYINKIKIFILSLKTQRFWPCFDLHAFVFTSLKQLVVCLPLLPDGQRIINYLSVSEQVSLAWMIR